MAAVLSGCGGNSTSLDPLAVSPSDAVAYNGNPVTLHISGGNQPYTITSSNSAVINVSPDVGGSTVVFDANNVGEDTQVNLDVRDLKGTLATASITVKPSVITNSVTVTPDSAAPGAGCGPAVCSGMGALVTVQLKNMATPLVNRTVKFDVAEGDYQFITNPGGTTFADTITAATDQNGDANVRIRANTDAPTQYAILKVTDVAGGSVLQTAFTIAQYTNGEGILSVVPDTHTITSRNKGTCSYGVRVDYIIHGGTAPYTVISTSPGVATVSPSTVLTNGAGFTATTNNGFCPGEAVFDIKDATGRTITATLENEEGTEEVPTAPPVAFYTTAPASITVTATATANFVAGGGTSPYYVSSSNTAVATASISGANLTVTAVASGTATIIVSDSKGSTKSINVTVP
jgi:hypothetical protein